MKATRIASTCASGRMEARVSSCFPWIPCAHITMGPSPCGRSRPCSKQGPLPATPADRAGVPRRGPKAASLPHAPAEVAASNARLRKEALRALFPQHPHDHGHQDRPRRASRRGVPRPGAPARPRAGKARAAGGWDSSRPFALWLAAGFSPGRQRSSFHPTTCSCAVWSTSSRSTRIVRRTASPAIPRSFGRWPG